MPSSRLVFRIDVALVLAFVALSAYARHVQLRQLAPLTSGPPIELYTAAPQAPALTVVAAAPRTGPAKAGGVAGGATGAIPSNGFVVTGASPAQSEIASTAAEPPADAQPSCGNTASSCTPSFEGAATPKVAMAGEKAGSSDDDVVSDGSIVPIVLGNMPITQLYTDMLLGVQRPGVIEVASAGEFSWESNPVQPAVGFTPTTWEVPFLNPLEAGPPSPFYLMPPALFIPDPMKKDPDATKKGDGPKKLGDGGPGDGDFSGGNRNKNQTPVTATPEPATLTMLGTGIAVLGTMRRRRKAAAA